MRKCEVCGNDETKNKLITINNKLICWGCYRRKKEQVFDLPKYGEIKTTDKGLIVCHICGRAYKRPMSHVTQVHGMTALEYKRKFGLDLHSGIISEDSKELSRKRAMENWDKIQDNLLVKGREFRFSKGHEGRIKEKVSEQTAKRLRHWGKNERR